MASVWCDCMILPGVIASSGGVASSYESIATYTAATAQSSIVWSSIPSTYSHLQIRCMNKLTTGGNIRLYFNTDTGANAVYDTHYLYGDGTTASAARGSQQPYAISVGFTYYTTQFNVFIADIFNYSNTTTYKTVRSLSGCDNNGSGDILLNSGLWMRTNAISTITLAPQSGNFAQYSHFALYGVKA